MLHKDLYIGENLTLDLVMKVEIIVAKISKEEGSEFEEVFIKLLNSNTYRTLKNKIFSCALIGSKTISIVISKGRLYCHDRKINGTM